MKNDRKLANIRVFKSNIKIRIQSLKSQSYMKILIEVDENSIFSLTEFNFPLHIMMEFPQFYNVK